MTRAVWPRIAVLGAGAVGCYFGGMLSRAGAPVTLIARPGHADAINANQLRLQTLSFDERVPVRASTEVGSVADADLILLTVKTLDTETAAAALSRHAGPAATVVSLQNGVDNVDRIRSASGIDAVASVIYVAVSMSGPGEVRHQGRGDIVIGNLPGQNRDLGSLSRVFIQGGIPCVISPSIEGELWKKLIVNCAYNAISALVRSQYGRIVADPGTRQTLARAVEETVAVARAAGVELGGEDMVQSAINLGQHMMPGATSSTAQDLERGKQTEIDSLNGYVARRGGELGVRTPVNETLWALVKLLEKSSGN